MNLQRLLVTLVDVTLAAKMCMWCFILSFVLDGFERFFFFLDDRLFFNLRLPSDEEEEEEGEELDEFEFDEEESPLEDDELSLLELSLPEL